PWTVAGEQRPPTAGPRPGLLKGRLVGTGMLLTKTADDPPLALECVDVPERARALLSPLRLEVLARAREPRSATEIAGELALPRQKVNYHVKELHRARFLRPAGRRRKRNLTEQRYVATARSYVLAPGLLGPLECRPHDDEDALSAACLIGAGTRMVSDVV